jgi:hypothetical protein
MSNWVEKWDVVGSSGKPYVVSRAADNTFGCSCPAWKFQRSGGAPRKDCAHIANKKVELMQSGQMPVFSRQKPVVVVDIRCKCPISFKGIPDLETQVHRVGCPNAEKEKETKKEKGPVRSIRF